MLPKGLKKIGVLQMHNRKPIIEVVKSENGDESPFLIEHIEGKHSTVMFQIPMNVLKAFMASEINHNSVLLSSTGKIIVCREAYSTKRTLGGPTFVSYSASSLPQEYKLKIDKIDKKQSPDFETIMKLFQ